MRSIQALIVLIALSTLASAQTFTFTFQDSSLLTSANPADVITSGILTNTSTDSISILATRLTNVQDSGWTTAVCMAICMASDVDTSGSYKIPPGGTQLFLLHFGPTSVPGTGNVKMQFHDIAHPAFKIVQEFHLTTGGTTQFTWPALTNNKLYFGEVDTIKWSTSQSGTAELSLSTDAGDSWTVIAASLPLSAGMFAWSPDFAFVNNAKLRLRTAQGSLISDLSVVTGKFYNPVPGTVIKSGAPDTIKWTPGVSGSADFEYAIGGGSFKKVTSGVSMSGGKYVWTPAASIDSKQVRVRLKTTSWIMASDFFTVSPNVGVSDDIPMTTTVSASPNPASSNLMFRSSVSGIDRITLFDMLGRTVADVYPDLYGTPAVDVSFLPAGMYLARITANRHFTSIPVSVMH